MKRRGDILIVFSILFFSALGFSNHYAILGTGNGKQSAAALIEKGKNAKIAGEFDKAAAIFKDTLKLTREIKSPAKEATCLLNLGVTSWDLGQIQEAALYFADAAELFHIQRDGPTENVCRKAVEIARLYNLGKGCRSANQNQQSLEFFNKAIDLGRETGIEDFELKCARQMSLTYWQMGDMEMFCARSQRGLEIAKKINHRKEVGRCLNNVGIYFEKMCDYSNALRNYEMAQIESRRGNDLVAEAEALSNIGGIYLELDNLVQAGRFYERALGLDRSCGSKENVAMDLNNLGIVLLKRAQSVNSNKALDQALGYFQECMKLLDETKDAKIMIQVSNNIGYIFYLRGDYSIASREFAKCYSRAIDIGYRDAIGVIEMNLGNIELDKKNYQNAILHFYNAVNKAPEISSNILLWEAYFGLGRCYEAKNDRFKALMFYKKSIEAMETIRRRISLDMFKISFARSKMLVYQRAMDILHLLYLSSHSEALLEEIFQMAERAKARAFLESLVEANIDVENKANPELVDMERKISREISMLNRKIIQPGISKTARKEEVQELELKEEEYLRLISEIRTERRAMDGLTPSINISISKVQTGLLDKRTALLEYFVGDNKSYLLLITLHHVGLFELPGKPNLENSLRGYLKSLSSPSPGPFIGIRAAERIAKELISPLQNEIDSEIDTLIIIPDGILDYLPFETLRIKDGERPIYLVEKYKVSYCPSSTALFFLRQRPRVHSKMKNFLAFGDPIYQERISSGEIRERAPIGTWRELYLDEGLTLSSLPFSKKEVLKVSRHFPSDKKDIYLGKEANEAILKKLPLREYQIIHFACHGILDDNFPFRSALVLSNGDNLEEDGFLQAREIYNLRMNADLVVLSACEAGNGALENGEGLIGLTRTFFHAGAHAVLSSIWSINDQSTASYMEDFYDCLTHGQDKSSALRIAKLKMLRSRRSHPFYWAGFILNGDPAPVQFEGNSAQMN